MDNQKRPRNSRRRIDMGELGLEIFDRTIHETNSWLKEIGEELGHPDRQMAYHALRGVMFALRDRLTPDEAADFAAQLPLLIRGIFYEGYKPAGKPEKYRDRDEWLKRVNRELEAAGGQNPEAATRAVLSVINDHLSPGEIGDARQMLPGSIRELWPNGINQNA